MSATKKPAAPVTCNGKKFDSLGDATIYAAKLFADRGIVAGIEPATIKPPRPIPIAAIYPRLTASELKYRVTQTRHDSHFLTAPRLNFLATRCAILQ